MRNLSMAGSSLAGGAPESEALQTSGGAAAGSERRIVNTQRVLYFLPVLGV